MILRRRSFARLTCVFMIAILTGGSHLFAQSPEALLASGEYDAAAKAFTLAGGRENFFLAGTAWYEPDSLIKAANAFLSATRADDGELVEDSLSGLAFHKAGLCYYYLEEDERAIGYYRKAVAVRDRVFTGPHNDRAKSRKNLATSMRFLGQLDSAALLTREAINIYEHLPRPDTTNWLRGLNELGAIALEMQDMQLAHSSFLAARPLAAFVSAEDRFNYYYLGARIYLGFQDFEEAINYAQKAVALAERAEEPSWLADVLTVLAGAQRQSKRPKAAKRSYLRAAELLKQDPYATESLRLVYLNLASLLGGEKNEPEALRFLDLAGTGYAEDPTRLLLEITKRKGIVLIDANKSEAALELYNEGLLELGGQRKGNHELVQISPDSISPVYYEEIAHLLCDRGLALANLNRTEAALEAYEAYFQWLELLRSRVNSDASRQYLSQNLRPVFDKAIGLLAERSLNDCNQEDLWRALALSERAKAYSLLTNLQRDRSKMPKRESDLRTRIATLERGNSSPATLEAARLELDRLVQQQKADILVTSDFVFNEAELLAMLTQQESDLLAFHLGEEQGHLFMVNHKNGQITYANIEKVGNLTAAVEAWRETIAASAYKRKSLRPADEQIALDEAFQEQGAAIMEQLFGGKERVGGLPTGNVLIIPDGALSFLPFSCLPLSKSKPPFDYSTYGYFAKDRTISYAYSASVLLAQSKRDVTEYTGNLLAFAPSFKGKKGTNQRAVRQKNLRALESLQPLKYNRAEVEAISSFIPRSESYYGKKASRKHFIDHIGTARIVHLSSHGTVNAADPRLSFVAFSQFGDSLELEELLYFNDLSSLAINAELVVLSACETSLGEYVPGETTLSLASAFTASGARSTLTTLWSVDDEATKDLMIRFYRSMAEGKSRAKALSEAQLTHRASPEYAHPYYWSAMTLYGASGAVELTPAEDFPIRWALGGLAALAVATLLFFRRKLLA